MVALDKKTDCCDLYAYHEAISMITLPLTPYLFLPKIAINYRGIPPRFRQATTIAVGHDRDCCTQFEYSCKQPYHIVKIFKIHTGPEGLRHQVLRM